jgi:hypothetical protein
LRYNGSHHRLDKHAVAHGAIEVTLSLNTAIVFAGLLFQFDAYPLANLKVCSSSEADNGFAAIVELDSLPRLEIWHYDILSKSWGIVPAPLFYYMKFLSTRPRIDVVELAVVVAGIEVS